MYTCTFFGHRNASEEIEPLLYSTLIDLVENRDVSIFLVGNNGSFDRMVRKSLKALQLNYPEIRYGVALAYMPGRKSDYSNKNDNDTFCPYVFEKTPPKYAIIKRNKWLIDNSDYVVTYVKHTVGGAAQFKELAEKKGKTVINLVDKT